MGTTARFLRRLTRNSYDLFLGVYVFSDWRLCALGLPLGWLPILAVALRRPEHPSRADIGVVFGGFPAVFALLALVDYFYFHTA